MKFTRSLFLSLFLLLLCIVLFAWIYIDARQDRIDEFNKRQMSQVRMAAVGIENHFDSLVRTMSVLASDDHVINLNQQGMDHLADLLKFSSPYLKNVSRVGPSGIILFSTPARIAGQDVSHRPYFKEIIRTHKPVVSDVFDALPGDRAISIQVPVFRAGRFNGTVGALLDFDLLARHYVEVLKTEEDGYAWLISGNGTEIHCPVPGHVGNSVFENCKEFPDIIAMAEKMVRGESGVTTYKYNRVRGKVSETLVKQAVYMPIKVGNTFWSIVLATPEDSIIGLMADFRNKMLACAGLILLIGCVITYIAVTRRKDLDEDEKRRKAERSLSESEARYRSLVDTALTGVFQTNVDGKIVFANQAMASIMGFDSPEELIGKSIAGFYRDIDDRAANIKAIKRDGSINERPLKGVDRNGRNIDLLLSASLKEDIISGMIMDVSSQRRQEQSLRESEARFRALFQQSPMGVSIARDGVTMHTNPRAAQIFGYEVNEQTGTPQLGRIAPECRDQIIERFEKRRRGEFIPNTFETTGLKKDGSRIPIFVRTIDIQLEDGPAVVSFIEDLTTSKRTEEALKESQQRLADIIDFLPDATLVIDNDGKVIAWSKAMEELTGIKAEDMLGKGDYEYSLPFYGERRPILIDLALRPDGDFEKSSYMDADRQRTSLSGEAYMPALRGGEIYLLGTASVLRDSRGNVVGAIESMRDVTARRQAELALKESQQRLADIINFLPDATLVIDNDGKVIAWNKAIEEMTGIKAEDMLGKGDYEYALPFYGERRPIIIDLALRPDGDFEKSKYLNTNRLGTSLSGEAYMPAMKGGEVYLLGTASVLRDSRGNVVGAIESIRDITERRQAELELKESQQRLADIIDFLPDATLVIDTEGKVIAWNRAIEQMTGIKAEDMLGKGNYEYALPFYGERRPIVIDLVLAEHMREDFEGNYITFEMRDKVLFGEAVMTALRGGGVILSATAAVLRDSKGHIVGAIEAIRDITERRQAEQKYRSIFENAAEGIFQSAPDGRLLNANPALARIFGFGSPEEMIMTVNEGEVEFFVDPKMRSEVKGLLDRQGFVRDFQSDLFRKKDGSKLWLSINMMAVKDEKGQLMYYEGTSQDITESKSLESRLVQAQKMEAIGTMAGGIAHDFNNILASIMGYTELTMSRVSNESLSRYLRQVLNACGRARNLISQILTFSRQHEKEVKPIIMGPLVKEALKLLRASIPSTIEIDGEIHAETRAVVADPIQIHQVIMNLCTNAAYEMREKGGILGLKLRDTEVTGRENEVNPDLAPGNYVELTVTDTGRGIGKDIINRIFDPFFTTKKKGEGTGLGLSVVYGIVKECGGTISVSSEPGLGASFTVLLPAMETPSAFPEKASDIIPRGTETVLFVDDEEGICLMGQDMLESLGYSVFTFRSAMAALESFQARPGDCDIVITDMTMPGMTGADLAIEILKIRPGIPVILCTGYSQLISEADAKNMGISEFVMKPYPVREMAQAIRRALDGPLRGESGA